MNKVESFFGGAWKYVTHGAAQVAEQKLTSTFLGVGTAVLQLMVNSIQVDIFIFLGMILMIALNTFSGVRLARKNKTFDLTKLKESVIGKSVGYTMLLTGVSLFCIILFVASLRDDTRLVDDYWYNLPVILLMVFMSSVEFKSLLDNLESLGIYVPGFVKKMPGKIQDKIEDMTEIK
ncbi:MAG TPA: phage holin family protein [Leadbetterella sp.]|nr:phage holin family protein [Leadbetterella sp.]